MDLVKNKKRKAPEDGPSDPAFPLDELNQDLLERVLSRLPASSFFRLRSVCKRWTSAAASKTFRGACSEILFREPWYLMVGEDLDRPFFFDTSELNWKSLNYNHILSSGSIPVASSGGLVCFSSPSGGLVVSNPVTGDSRELPKLGGASEGQVLHAIVMMNTNPKDFSQYKIILVLGEFSNLAVKILDSEEFMWEDPIPLRHESDYSPESVYFLGKAGVVVAADTQRSPSKEFSSVLTMENGEEVVYFLSQSGTVACCNLSRRTFFELPKIMPVYFEYSIDVVECNGEMMAVVLSEFFETASLRVWRFSKGGRSWVQVAAMPPSMSNDYYGKKADINCAGHGDTIFICVNSGEISSCIVCNVVANEWVELPKCLVNGRAKEFMAAFCFEPRVEVSV